MTTFVDALLGDAPSLWCALGLLLLIIEVLFPNGFYISFSLGAFLVAGLLWADIISADLMWNAIYFSLLGVMFIPICRKILKIFDKTKDINEY